MSERILKEIGIYVGEHVESCPKNLLEYGVSL